MRQLDLIPVAPDRQRLVHADRRQRSRRRWRNRAVKELHRLFRREPLARRAVGNDRKPRHVHPLVAAGVVAVPMSIDEQPTRRLRRNRRNRRANPRNRRCEARIHEQAAVGAGLQHHVAARSLQQIDVVEELRATDRHVRRVVLLRCGLRRRLCRCGLPDRSLSGNNGGSRRRAQSQKMPAIHLPLHRLRLLIHLALAASVRPASPARST